jgi:hypothetical protein
MSVAAWVHVRLQVIRQGHVPDQGLLRFQPVDRFLAVFEQVFEQVAADVVLELLAQGDALDQQRTLDFALVPEIALQAFDDILADQQLAEDLQVGQASRKRMRSISSSASFMTRIDCRYW